MIRVGFALAKRNELGECVSAKAESRISTDKIGGMSPMNGAILF